MTGIDSGGQHPEPTAEEIVTNQFFEDLDNKILKARKEVIFHKWLLVAYIIIPVVLIVGNTLFSGVFNGLYALGIALLTVAVALPIAMKHRSYSLQYTKLLTEKRQAFEDRRQSPAFE